MLMYTLGMTNKPFVLGLTGNIASGKSYVLNYLTKRGAKGIDADLVAQQSYLPGKPAYDQLIAHFGEGIKQPDGQIDRAAVAKIVFAHPDKLKELEAIVHPATIAEINATISDYLENGDLKLIVVEAIKLFESDLAIHCDATWVTIADDETRLSRLIQGRGMDPISAAKRLKSQSPQEAKAKLADYVITTDCNFEDTGEQIEAGLKKLGIKL